MYQEIFTYHAELLKALANSKRLEIIHLLRDQELSVSQMQDMLHLPQSNLSQHLMVLRKAGVVKSRREGKEVFYQVSHPHFIQASDLLREVLIEQHQGEEVASQLGYKMQELVPLAHDPVCGMRVSPKTAGFALKHNGTEYYFCASGCYEKFLSNKEVYIHEN